MRSHIVELLPDWLAGRLCAATSATVADHLVTCVDCAAVYASYHAFLGSLGASGVDAAAPPPSRPPGRLYHLAEPLCALCSVSLSAAFVALDSVDDAAGWEPSGLSNVDQRALPKEASGPRLVLVRMPPGASVPMHEHLGPERLLVLQGRLVADDGRVYLPGDAILSDSGSRHALVAEGGVDCVCGMIVERGVVWVG